MQAEPLDTATSLMPISSASPSTPGKLRLRLPGQACAIEPLIDVPSRRLMIASFSLSRRLREALAFFSHFLLANFARFAEADDAGNIQGAGAHAALWPPPSMMGASSTRGFLRRT